MKIDISRLLNEPLCSHSNNHVVRTTKVGSMVKRYRECWICGTRYFTIEIPETNLVTLIKSLNNLSIIK